MAKMMAGVGSIHPGIPKLKPLRNYHLEELIGNGSFSEVYKGTHKDSGEVLALKCFRQKMKTVAHYRIAAKEIAFMKILEHPNILPLKVYEISKMFVFIGTEFAEHGCLRTFIKEHRPVTEIIVKSVMKQVLSALDYMHTLGIFHGDLKPHNILCTSIVDNEPVVKICDFGLTEIKLKGCDLSYKSGSFLFMAPEVHLRHPVDVTCDLWSVGVVMYYMMLGHTLFNFSEKEREKHVTYMKRRVAPDFSGCERFSVDCNSLLRELLNYDKHKRPHGETLRKHPFLNLGDPPLGSAEKYLKDAHTHLDLAFACAANRNYGDALVEGTRAILELKIHHNLLEKEELRKYLRIKWQHYEDFTLAQERALAIAPDIPPDCSEETLNDKEFRKHLMSTPKLLDGFDIGCNAEMFMKEGNIDKALNMFHQALQLILPLMKSEPKSNRKEILGRRLKKWIQNVEDITNRLTSQTPGEEGTSAKPDSQKK